MASNVVRPDWDIICVCSLHFKSQTTPLRAALAYPSIPLLVLSFRSSRITPIRVSRALHYQGDVFQARTPNYISSAPGFVFVGLISISIVCWFRRSNLGSFFLLLPLSLVERTIFFFGLSGDIMWTTFFGLCDKTSANLWRWLLMGNRQIVSLVHSIDSDTYWEKFEENVTNTN